MATETPLPPPPGVVIEIPPPPGMATETPPPPETSHPLGMATETPPPPPGVVTEIPPPRVATETPTPPETSPPGMATETPPPPPGMATETSPPPPPGVATKTPPGMARETPPGRCASIFNVIGSTVSRHAFIFIVIMSAVPILGTGYFLVSTLLLLRRGGDPKCEYPRLEWDLWFDVFLLLLFLAGSIGVSFKAKAVQITCIALLGVTTLLIAVISWSVDIGGTFPEDTKRIDDAYHLETYAPWAHKFLLKDSGRLLHAAFILRV
ncbi:hypothetical protein RHGRI_013337 [Rhododendron griersonianum]|uniref:Uncharacterized protein n=1 Tax=Rhododendron griersonianum TaxID=479676 RepID=A0AAV6K595_9ERIC|nr:hypothetical protein RHGRI_013337 [Rhododendron griersonianum]